MNSIYPQLASSLNTCQPVPDLQYANLNRDVNRQFVLHFCEVEYTQPKIAYLFTHAGVGSQFEFESSGHGIDVIRVQREKLVLASGMYKIAKHFVIVSGVVKIK